MFTKKQKFLIKRWSYLLMGLGAVAWIVYWISVGFMPVVSKLAITESIVIKLPFGIPRIFDLLIIPFFVALFIHMSGKDYDSNFPESATVIGICFGVAGSAIPAYACIIGAETAIGHFDATLIHCVLSAVVVTGCTLFMAFVALMEGIQVLFALWTSILLIFSLVMGLPGGLVIILVITIVLLVIILISRGIRLFSGWYFGIEEG